MLCLSLSVGVSLAFASSPDSSNLEAIVLSSLSRVVTHKSETKHSNAVHDSKITVEKSALMLIAMD